MLHIYPVYLYQPRKLICIYCKKKGCTENANPLLATLYHKSRLKIYTTDWVLIGPNGNLNPPVLMVTFETSSSWHLWLYNVTIYSHLTSSSTLAFLVLQPLKLCLSGGTPIFWDRSSLTLPGERQHIIMTVP